MLFKFSHILSSLIHHPPLCTAHTFYMLWNINNITMNINNIKTNNNKLKMFQKYEIKLVLRVEVCKKENGKWKLNSENPKTWQWKWKKYSKFTRRTLYLFVELYTWIISILPILNIYILFSLFPSTYCMRMTKLWNSLNSTCPCMYVVAFCHSQFSTAPATGRNWKWSN